MRVAASLFKHREAISYLESRLFLLLPHSSAPPTPVFFLALLVEAPLLVNLGLLAKWRGTDGIHAYIYILFSLSLSLSLSTILVTFKS